MEMRVNPAMIILARESRGLTQKELADRLKIEQYEVSRLESGLSPRLADEKVSALSKILRYPKSFFYQTFPIYSVGMNFYRKHKGLPVKDLKRIEAIMNVQRAHIKRLLSSVDIDFLPIKECTIDDYGSPEEVARAIRQYLRLPRGRVDNMTQVLERFGIIIIPYSFESRKFAGASLLVEGNTYIVFVNDMPMDRWRFTLDHELGHLIMHGLPSANMEEEADRFAAEFLMPEMDIKHQLRNIAVDTLANLKLYWRVAMSALLKRAHTLETITDRQYRTFWQKMSKYRLQEPKELEPPIEKPSLLYEIVNFHLEDLRHSIESLSEILSTDVEEFISLYKPTKSRLRLVVG